LDCLQHLFYCRWSIEYNGNQFLYPSQPEHRLYIFIWAKQNKFAAIFLDRSGAVQ